jgi:hypothetical protein
MINSPPIPSPPLELVQQWLGTYFGTTVTGEVSGVELALATQAARWGADQELQACINFVYDNELCDPDFYNNLRTSRRPKPPTLKEQALYALDEAESSGCLHLNGLGDTIRRALEALPND